MRLDDATDFSDIRVQCLGKNYHATQDAWHCLDEVRELRREYSKDKNDPDHSRAKVFNEVEQRYVNPKPLSRAVENILSGFGLSDETPNQRVERFKGDLQAQINATRVPDSTGPAKGWFGF